MRDETRVAADGVRVAVGVVKRHIRDDGFVGVSPSEATVLARLDELTAVTTATLARLEDVTPQAMGATVAALSARGLIERAADPSDRRRVLLSLSPAGQAVLHRAEDAINDRLGVALEACFDAADIALIGRAAQLLTELARVL